MRLSGAEFLDWWSRWADPSPWPDFAWAVPDDAPSGLRDGDGRWTLDPETVYGRGLLGEIRSSTIRTLWIDTDAIIECCIAYDRKNGFGPAPTVEREEETSMPPTETDDVVDIRSDTASDGTTTASSGARTAVVVVPLGEHAELREALRREGVLTLDTPSNGKKVTGADLHHFLATALPEGLSWRPSQRFPERDDVHPGSIHVLKELGEIVSCDPTVRAPTTSSVFRDYLRDRGEAPLFVRIPAASADRAARLLEGYGEI